LALNLNLREVRIELEQDEDKNIQEMANDAQVNLDR